MQVKTNHYINDFQTQLAVVDSRPQLNRYTDEFADIVLLSPALVVYSMTSKCIRVLRYQQGAIQGRSEK